MAIINRDYVFTFGKYKGDHIDEVLKEDPQYLIWCQENMDWFEMTDTLEKLANDYAENRK